LTGQLLRMRENGRGQATALCSEQGPLLRLERELAHPRGLLQAVHSWHLQMQWHLA
jgi:hypothetical protein